MVSPPGEHKDISTYLSLMALRPVRSVELGGCGGQVQEASDHRVLLHMAKVKDAGAKAAGGSRITPEEQAIFG